MQSKCKVQHSAQGRCAVNISQHVCRDVASGSKRITEVLEAFHSSAETLEQQAKTYGVSRVAQLTTLLAYFCAAHSVHATLRYATLPYAMLCYASLPQCNLSAPL